MKIIRDWQHCPQSAQGSVVALGNFEGLHLGHQALLKHALETAKRAGAPCAVMTFEPHPREYFDPSVRPLRIYPLSTKIRLLREAGIALLFLCRFNRSFASLSAEEFIERVLMDGLHIRHAVTGDNFVFGRGRGGNAQLLEQEANRHQFGYSRIAPVIDTNGQVCSSSRIRHALKAGDMPLASALLGRPYAIEGRVLHGEGRGKALGFPTANLRIRHLFQPAHGVYAVRMALPDGRCVRGVANLGMRPTFDGKMPLLEAHCLEESPSLYGQRIRVELAQRLREERKFDSAEALSRQIAQDAQQAREVLATLERKRA